MGYRVGLICILAAVALGATPGARGADSGPARPPLVVIDPGHGGPNNGALGAGREKDVTLAVARRIAARIEEATGARVVLTRDGDWHLPLQDRAEMANQLRADAFVSIHCNASDEPGPQGFETWFLSQDGSRGDLHQRKTLNAASSAPAARATVPDVAAGDDAVPHVTVPDVTVPDVTVPDAVQSILGDLVAQGAHRGGQRLAQTIHDALGVAAPDSIPRGVRQGAYTVLVAAAMPATVVEMGFLNHPKEGPSLLTPTHQSRLATGIADGVIHFLRRTGRIDA